MFVVSLLLMVISTSENAGPIRELSYEYYAVFRGVFLISYFFLLYGACLFIWRRVRVDYPAVLRVSYAHTYQYILRGSSSIAYIVFACFIAYVITLTGGFDDLADRNVLKHLWPALAFFLPVVLFLCPIDTLTEPVFGVKIHGFSQRADLLSELFAVLRSPFSSPSFHRCFIADILCSLPKIYPDLQYTLCIYATGRFWEPERADWQFDKHAHAYDSCGGGSSVYAAAQILLALLPFHIRLWQCLRAYYEHGFTRHIFNALKYLLTILLTALSLARNSSTAEWNAFYGRAWLHFGVIATIYSFFWDVIMDW